MRRLLERSVASVSERLVLLAPPHAEVPDCFGNVTLDAGKRDRLVHQMQRLRGSVYLRDGAIKADQLSADGLHRTAEDDKSWHVVMLGPGGDVSACAWYMEHGYTAAFDNLRVRNCPLSRDAKWAHRLWEAVESDLARARCEKLYFAEIGGWAVSESSRCSTEGLVLALIWYSLGKLRGEALGLTTATVRHSSSTILRRLGASSLDFRGEPIPSYFDPRYDCEMELLRFDSRQPNPTYKGLIDMLGSAITAAPVIVGSVSQVATMAYAVRKTAAPQPLFAA